MYLIQNVNEFFSNLVGLIRIFNNSKNQILNNCNMEEKGDENTYIFFIHALYIYSV